ncbi:MAG: carboxypeptidase regulatory-like domain-containing protein [Candidatus Cloacimonadales bacterium]|nr:carboxypeptidase regulatory-like domain-containing protein [Candidatus Cloacimonadales bacterium]
MKKLVFTFLLLLGISMGFAQNFEGFENGNFLSHNWHFSGSEDWFITFDDSFEGVYSVKSGVIANSQYSNLYISMEVVANSDISFYWKVSSQQYADSLKFYVDDVEIIGISGSVDWTQLTYNVSPGYHTFAWKYEKNQLTASGLDAGWIDNITFPQTTTFTDDLAAKSIQGPSTVYQGSSNIYNVVIKNYGSSTQDNYIVRLFREGGELLDELAVNDPLVSEAEYTHQLVWIIPPNEPNASTFLYAEVELTGDEDLSNNISDNWNANIYEIGLAQIYVGSENEETNWYPFKMHMHYSLAETIYFPGEITYTGIIHAIGYPKHFISNVVNTPIRVFIDEVTQSSLLSNWISGSTMNEVYNGTVDIAPGYGTLVIPFDNTYTYNGGNLCVLNFHQYDGNDYSINDAFMETINTPHNDRTRALGSPNSLSPTSPPADQGFIFSRFPNTIFYMEITGLGVLEGNVHDDQGNLLTTAGVTVQQIYSYTVTNGSGFYRFGNIIQGTYNVIASKNGYESQTQTGIIVADQTTVLDFNLNPLPKVEVSGQVVGSDEPEIGLENADIYFFGEFDYQTVTEANGDFVFPAVYANENYTLAISRYGYDTIWQAVSVGSIDLDLGTIVMNETALPPSDLYAEQNLTGTEVTLTWNPQNSFNREFEGCEVYRFYELNSNDPSSWTTISTSVIDTFFVDTEWISLPISIYQYALKALYSNGIVSDTIFSNIVEKATGANNNIPLIKTALQSIHPNPFNPQTAISYFLADEAEVDISVYNVKGQLVDIMVEETQVGGNHTVVWNGKDTNNKQQSSGIYFVQMLANRKNIGIRKCILLK